MRKTATLFIMLGAFFAFVSVTAGAFGAHALRAILEPHQLAVYETAAKYQMYHALALIVVGSLAYQAPDAHLTRAAWFFCVGILLFSGSLYIVATLGIGWVGAITPIGGVAFLCGWALMILAFWRRLRTS